MVVVLFDMSPFPLRSIIIIIKTQKKIKKNYDSIDKSEKFRYDLDLNEDHGCIQCIYSLELFGAV